MASFLDMLGGAVPFASNAVASYDDGKRLGFEDRLAQQQEAIRARQAEEDRKAQQRLQALNMRNIQSQIDTRNQPKPETGTDWQYDPVRGVRVNKRTGEVEQLENLPNRPTATNRRIDPLSPEGIEAAGARARSLAAVETELGGRETARPTESQEKSYLFSSMMAQASPIIDELAGKVNANAVSASLSPMAATVERFTGPGSVTGRITGPDEQRLLNAARTFAAGILRNESGAAITPDELRDTFARFIPLAGDTPEVIAQKQANRRSVEALMSDLSLPATTYYQRIREFYPNAPVAPSGTPPVSRGTPNTQSAPMSYAEWVANKNRTGGGTP